MTVLRWNTKLCLSSSLYHSQDTPQKLAKDWEVQEWGKMLADEGEGLGIKVRNHDVSIPSLVNYIAGASRCMEHYPLDSEFFNHCKNA